MRTLFPLVLVIMLGAMLRFWGLGYDLPNVYNLDEPHIVNKAVAVIDGKLRLKEVLRGSLPIYIPAITTRIFSLFLPAVKGGFPTITEGYKHNKTVIFVIARSVSALYGTAEMLILFWIGWVVFGKKVALLSTLFLSVSPLAIQFAHVVSPDTGLSATMLLTITVAMLAHHRHSVPLFIVAGLLAGFSASQKFPGIITLLFVLAVFIIEAHNGKRNVSHAFRYSLLILLSFVLTFILSNPYLSKDFNILVSEWRFETSNIRYWDRPPYIDFGILYRMKESAWWLRRGTGTFLFYFSIFGLFLAIKRKNTLMQVIGLFTVWFFLANAMPVKINESRFLPLVPFICLFAASAFERLEQFLFIDNKRLKPTRNLGVLMVVLCMSLVPFIKSFFLVRAFGSTDTRNLAIDWVTSHRLNEWSVLRDPFTLDESNFTNDPAHGLYSPIRDQMIHKQTIASLQNYRHAIVNDEFAKWYYFWEQYQPELHKIADVYRYLNDHTNKVVEFIPSMTNINEEDVDFLLHADRWILNQIRGPKITIYKLQ